MAVQERHDSGTGTDGSVDTMLIDTDIHERLESKEQLVPYMKPLWQRHLTQYAGVFPERRRPTAGRMQARRRGRPGSTG